MSPVKKIIIAGASSRSGKTAIACGLLSSLRKRGLKVTAFKTGPDYIDTEYLRRAGKCQAHNLDTWLMSSENV
ncbi:MAG: cobyrinic acid a,c-diamide synthase, partial [Synergistaceae bacterium]|nr:cobyrinic acid a,c-diamide synthase [Synergistaceae bacterium]